MGREMSESAANCWIEGGHGAVPVWCGAVRGRILLLCQRLRPVLHRHTRLPRAPKVLQCTLTNLTVCLSRKAVKDCFRPSPLTHCRLDLKRQHHIAQVAEAHHENRVVAPTAAGAVALRRWAVQWLRLRQHMLLLLRCGALLGVLEEALTWHCRLWRRLAAYEHVVRLHIAVRHGRVHLVHGAHATADLHRCAAGGFERYQARVTTAVRRQAWSGGPHLKENAEDVPQRQAVLPFIPLCQQLHYCPLLRTPCIQGTLVMT